MPVALLLLQTTCLPPLSPLPPVSLSFFFFFFFFRLLFARETKKPPNNNFNNQSKPEQTKANQAKTKGEQTQSYIQQQKDFKQAPQITEFNNTNWKLSSMTQSS